MFSYTNTEIRPVDGPEPLYSFRRYEAQRNGLTFNVAAVWTWATKSVKTRYRQAHEGFERHASWIRERPTVVLGDFNAHASFSGRNWVDLMELIQPLGLVSDYHHHFKQAFGEETRSTHFHRNRLTSPFHIDYCFVSEPLAQRITNVEVGRYDDWRHVSDHVPLVVDFALQRWGSDS